MIVYIIHFERRLAHAQHYIGTTTNFEKRIRQHRKGTGAKILRAANNRGIKWEVVYKTFGSRTLEGQLKARKNTASLCPRCKEAHNAKQTEGARRRAEISKRLRETWT